jgi:hypothetical protein
MHAVINHTIHDSVKWEQSTQRIMSLIEKGRLPDGLKPVEYLPSVDKHHAVCVWEARSLATLREFMERETGGAARNDYFELATEQAIGLPKTEVPPLARAA